MVNKLDIITIKWILVNLVKNLNFISLISCFLFLAHLSHSDKVSFFDHILSAVRGPCLRVPLSVNNFFK